MPPKAAAKKKAGGTTNTTNSAAVNKQAIEDAEIDEQLLKIDIWSKYRNLAEKKFYF